MNDENTEIDTDAGTTDDVEGHAIKTHLDAPDDDVEGHAIKTH